MSQVPAKVDDTDPRVEYLPHPGVWMLGGVQEEFDSTSHGTAATGSQVRFTFKGSYVNVFGTISNKPPYPDAPISTYSLDGLSPQEFHPSPPNGISYRQPFYRSPFLEYAQHVLVITFTASSNASFWLDYFEITPDEVSITPSPSPPPLVTSPLLPSPPSSTSNSLQTPPSTPVPSTFVPSSVTQLPSSSTPTDPSNTNSTSASGLPSKNSVPIGPIIGSVLGGMVLILLVFFYILYYRRKKGPQKSFPDIVVRRVSIRPTRSSFGIHQPPPSIYPNSKNSRFNGGALSFTNNLGSAAGIISDRITHADETVVPRDTMNYPDRMTSCGTAGMRVERGDEPCNMDAPPPYS